MYQFIFYNIFFVMSLSFLAQSTLPRYFSCCPVHGVNWNISAKNQIQIYTYKYVFKRKMDSNFSNVDLLTLKVSLPQKNNYIWNVHTFGDT